LVVILTVLDGKTIGAAQIEAGSRGIHGQQSIVGLPIFLDKIKSFFVGRFRRNEQSAGHQKKATKMKRAKQSKMKREA
jgi:hypothetical protein